MKRLQRPTAALFGTLAAWAVAASVAHAASLVVDDYAAPSAPSVSVLSGVGEATFNDFSPTVLGGVRGVYHHVFNDPLNSVSVVAVGNGLLSSSDGVGATSEVLVSYGAFTRPTGDPSVPGPLLGLDLSPYAAFAIDFTGVAIAMNINVTLYTSHPIDAAGADYYSTTGINVTPASPGGPLLVSLPFVADPDFNYAQVDGIVLVLNRAIGTETTNNAFNLDRFALVSSVPEAPAPWTMFAGLLSLACVQAARRRQPPTARHPNG